MARLQARREAPDPTVGLLVKIVGTVVATSSDSAVPPPLLDDAAASHRTAGAAARYAPGSTVDVGDRSRLRVSPHWKHSPNSRIAGGRNYIRVLMPRDESAVAVFER